MTENEELQNQPGEEIRMPDIAYRPGYNKLDSFDWLKDIPESETNDEIVEIRFKNTRKGFFRNVNGLRLEIGDIVAVEASPGHDIGIVCLTGELVKNQMKRNGVSFAKEDEKAP